MGKINFLSNERGKGLYSSTDSTWEMLNKIVNGELIEDSTSLTLKPSNNEISDKIIYVNKEHVYLNSSQFITYRVNLKFGGGLQILLEKYKNQQGKFALKGFHIDSFKITFEAYTGYSDDFSSIGIHELPLFTKKQILNGKELALLYQALAGGLFSKPEKGCLLFQEGGFLFFEENYYEKLKNSIYRNFTQGKFAESNAEQEWVMLKNKIDNAEDVIDPDISRCSNYPVSK